MKVYKSLNGYIMWTFILLVCGCGRSVLVGGGGEAPDFDGGPHIFNSKENDTILVAKNNIDWWFAGIRTDFEDYSAEDGDSKSDECEYHSIGWDRSRSNDIGYEACWFTVEKISSNRLRIAIKENQTGKNRKLSFSLQDGNAFRDIIIEQKAE